MAGPTPSNTARKPPARSTTQTPTAPPRKPPARSATGRRSCSLRCAGCDFRYPPRFARGIPAEHAALLRCLRSRGSPTEPAPFIPTLPADWVSAPLAAGRDSAPLAAGRDSAPLAAGRDSAPLGMDKPAHPWRLAGSAQPNTTRDRHVLPSRFARSRLAALTCESLARTFLARAPRLQARSSRAPATSAFLARPSYKNEKSGQSDRHRNLNTTGPATY